MSDKSRLLFEDCLPPDFLASPEVQERQMAMAGEAAKGKLADLRWRLRNLYCIKPEGGGAPRPFDPKPEQEVIFEHFQKQPHVPCYIIKSRRIGFSTGIGILMADRAVWTPGQNGMLVDQTQPDAHKKMREIIRYGIDSLPRPLLDQFEMPARATTSISIKAKGQEDSATSTIFAGMNARGGDASFLWLSEWFKFASDPKDHARSEEILTGAFPSARKGFRVVESTWKGGRNGHCWDLVKPIIEGHANADGVVYFFPWHADPQCVSLTGEITPDVREYFQVLSEKLDKSFTPEQKKWWAIEKGRLGIHMPQEYPSTLDEALSAPGDAPLFSFRGIDFAEKKGKALTTQYVSLSSNRANRTAQINVLTQDDHAAWLRVWERPMIGRHYLLSVDLCTGQMTQTTDPDFHAAGILRAPFADERGTIHPAAVVAAIQPKQRTPLDIFARQLAELSWYYGGCMTILEINKHAGFLEMCRMWGLDNFYMRTLYPDSKGDKRERKEPGWNTTAANKPVICETVGTFLREESLIVGCPRILSELRGFQINFEALPGKDSKDDWVMMLAMGLHNLHLATPYRGNAPPMAALNPGGQDGGGGVPASIMEGMPWQAPMGGVFGPADTFAGDSLLA